MPPSCCSVRCPSEPSSSCPIEKCTDMSGSGISQCPSGSLTQRRCRSELMRIFSCSIASCRHTIRSGGTPNRIKGNKNRLIVIVTAMWCGTAKNMQSPPTADDVPSMSLSLITAPIWDSISKQGRSKRDYTRPKSRSICSNISLRRIRMRARRCSIIVSARAQPPSPPLIPRDIS